MRFLIGLFLSLGFAAKSYTQDMVQDGAFDKMLQLLLSHDIPEVGVSEVADLKETLVLDAREKE